MSANSLAMEAVSNAGTKTAPPKNSTLAGLTKYIPTESITLYVALAAAQDAIVQVVPWIKPTVTFWFFVGFAPLLVLILFLRQMQTPKAKPVSVGQWPWARMVASSIAFFAWGIAVPGNPIIAQGNVSGGVVAGFTALLVSTVLNLVVPLFEKP